MPNQRSFALITGASAGLGKEFALQLAERYNLVLVARRSELLQELAHRCAGRGAQCETMAADLLKADDLARVEERVAKPDMALLVNNAGFGTYGAFASLPRQGEADQVQLNIATLVRLTHAALGTMTQRGSGSIINVASVAGYQPAPYSATYSATKTFVRYFTEAVAEEVRPQGVYMQVLCPGFTHTEFHERARIATEGIPSFLWMESSDVVRASLEAMDKGQTVCVPGAINKTITALGGATPNAVTAKLAAFVMRNGMGLK
jgi:short-subunit dehydrogenase